MAVMPNRGQLRKNLHALRERLEARPMDLDARMRMARTHRLLGEGRQAIAHYRSVARYLSLAGQPLRAIAVLKELLLVDPRHEETLLFLAKLYARTRSADATNRGRVAVPIIDDDTGPLALPEGLPPTATGIWRAIRPHSTDVYTVVHDPAEVGADEDVSIAAELRELDERYDLEELDESFEVDPTYELKPGDVLEERSLRTADGLPTSPAGASDTDRGPPTAPLSVDDDPFGYELLGPLATEDLVLPRVPIFSSLSPAAFIELGHAMVFQRARAGEVVFQEGDPGDSCIVISRGRAVATRQRRSAPAAVDDDATASDIELMRLGEGDFAGVFALVAGQERQASLRAETDLEYFEIDRLAIQELVSHHPAVGEVLQEFFKERLLLNLLASLPLFVQLDAGERQRVAASFDERTYGVDDELFYQGFEHDGVWVVLEGQVRVVSEADGELRQLRAGDYIGSLAGTAGIETACSSLAVTKSRVAMLNHKQLSRFLSVAADAGQVRQALADFGMMLDDVVFAGSGRLPGDLRP